jgi:predicted permease
MSAPPGTGGGAIRRAWRLLLSRRQVERAVTDELAFHLEESAAWLVEHEGMSLEQARVEARKRFGDRLRYRSECAGIDEQERRTRALSEWWNDLRQDLRFGWRQIRRTPGVTAAAVVCLAVGIGANTTVFDLTRCLLFSDTAYREPERMVRVYTHLANALEGGLEYASYSWPDYLDLKAQTTTLEELATGTVQPFHLADGDLPVRIWGEVVTGNWFHVHGIPMAAGRDFLPEEDLVPGARPVLLISWRLWHSRYGGDPAVVGRAVTLNGNPFTIIGVVDRGYTGLMVGIRSDLWVPMAMYPVVLPGQEDAFQDRGSLWLFSLVGRMRPGVSFEQTRAELMALQARLEQQYPESNKGISAHVVTERASRIHPLVRGQIQTVMTLIGAVVGLILLLTCANVAGLLLARASTRRREMAIRLALGAERSRIFRQVLTESVVLALLAGLLGLVLSQGTLPLLAGITPPIDMPFELALRPGMGTLPFVIVAALLAGLFFGLTPALEASRQDLLSTLTTGRVTTGHRTNRARRLFVGLQIAITAGLLVAGGMVLRSLRHAREIEVGFDARNVLTAWVLMELQGYDAEAARTYHGQVRERLTALPGVVSVGTGDHPQLQPSINATTVVPDSWEGPVEDIPSTLYNYIDDTYLETLRIPVVRGRGLSAGAGPESDPEVIVNQAFADRYWPGQDPIGHTLTRGERRMTVVGVVPTGKYFSLGEAPRPYVFFPMLTYMRTAHFYVIRTERLDPAVTARIREIFAEVDPTLPVANLTPMSTYLETARLGASVLAGLVTAFGGLALLLATVGLYGLIAYTTQQRTQEIGVRMALGAHPRDLVRMLMVGTLRQVALPLVAGILFGGAISYALSGALYGIEPFDPASISVALGVVTGSALLAGWLPARKAVRIDPVRAIQPE